MLDSICIFAYYHINLSNFILLELLCLFNLVFITLNWFNGTLGVSSCVGWSVEVLYNKGYILALWSSTRVIFLLILSCSGSIFVVASFSLSPSEDSVPVFKDIIVSDILLFQRYHIIGL